MLKMDTRLHGQNTGQENASIPITVNDKIKDKDKIQDSTCDVQTRRNERKTSYPVN